MKRISAQSKMIGSNPPVEFIERANPKTSPPLRVLIIEDSPRVPRLRQGQLRQAGLELTADVVSAPSGSAEALGSEPYEIVLADYNLPGWSGMTHW